MRSGSVAFGSAKSAARFFSFSSMPAVVVPTKTPARATSPAPRPTPASAAGRATYPRAGVFVGTTTAGMLENEKNLAALHADPKATDPLRTLLSHPISAPANRVAEALGLGGPRRTVCSACSSSAHAIAMARDAILRGDCDVAFAGGTNALSRLTYAGFNALGVLDADPCRPFDVSPDAA